MIPGLKAFNSTRRVPRSNQRFKDYTAVLRAVLLKLAQAVLEARISGGSREKIEEKIAPTFACLYFVIEIMLQWTAPYLRTQNCLS